MTGLTVPVITDDMDVLTAALAYADAGWYVLPVEHGSKHPGSVVGKGWHTQSSRDPQVLAAWFAGTDHGIALHCGRSGAVVFDVDDPDELPDVLSGCFSWSRPPVSPDAPPWQSVAAGLANLASLPPFQSTRPDKPDRGHYVFAQPPGRTELRR
jgi:hypothetical protein